MNVPKSNPANAIFKDAFGGAKIGELNKNIFEFFKPYDHRQTGHVNGVNVIGLSLQQNAPNIPASGTKPPFVNQTSVDFTSLQMHLQPRRPTTGNVDFLVPLQPELLLGILFIAVFSNYC